MSKSKLVLQNSLLITEQLNFIGKDIEVFGQGPSELFMVGLLPCHVTWTMLFPGRNPKGCVSILWLEWRRDVAFPSLSGFRVRNRD